MVFACMYLATMPVKKGQNSRKDKLYSHACNCCNENHFVAHRVVALFSLMTIVLMIASAVCGVIKGTYYKSGIRWVIDKSVF
jgi:hypothetical protein